MRRLSRTLQISCLITTSVVIAFGTHTYQEPVSTSALWQEPVEIESLDLFYGPGSPDREPTGTFTFVKELTSGESPKFEVVDENDGHWIVKLGEEAKSETAATRLLWAAGYFADEAYFIPELRVEQMPKLARGSELVAKDGVVRNVRLEPIQTEHKRIGDWSWFENPFAGTIDQIRDCFEAAGYSPEEVDGFATVVQQRIAELSRL